MKSYGKRIKELEAELERVKADLSKAIPVSDLRLGHITESVAEEQQIKISELQIRLSESQKEVERLSAKFSEYRSWIRQNMNMSFEMAYDTLLDTKQRLEVRLAEACSVLKNLMNSYVAEPKICGYKFTCGCAWDMATAFLQSPTISPLINRAELERAVIESGIKLINQTGINVLDCDDCYRYIEKQGHADGCRIANFVKAHDALKSLDEHIGGSNERD